MSDLHDKCAEAAVLAVGMRDMDAFTRAAAVVSAEDFGDAGFRLLWEAIDTLVAQDTQPDRTLARSIAASNAKSLRMDGEDIDKRLAFIDRQSAQQANAVEYAERVHRLAQLRRLRSTCESVLSSIDDQTQPDAIGAQAIDKLLNATMDGPTAKGTLSFGELQERYIERLNDEIAERKQGRTRGIKFDFPPFDDYTLGMRPDDGDLIVMGGDPGAGKTVLVMHMLRRLAIQQSVLPDPAGALFLSLEMGEESTAMRWAQMMAKLRTSDLRGEDLSEQKVSSLQTYLNHESGIPLYVNFSTGMYADQIKALVAAEKRRRNVKVIGIDHLRYIRLRNEPRDPQERDEARIKYIREEICRGLGVAAIVLAHTRKGKENADTKKPTMADLLGGQMIAAQADGICFVYRPWLYASDEDRLNNVFSPTEAYLVWVKNRVSQLEDARFDFHGATMRIEDAVTYGLPAQRPPTPPPAPSPQHRIAGANEW